MKHLKTKLAALWLLVMLTMLPAMTVFAAVKAPGNVAGLKAKAVSETSVQLTWKRASKASGYNIYRVTPTTGAVKKIAKTTKTSYTAKSLTPNKTYVYQVRAYRKSGKTTVESVLPSANASAKTYLRKPGKISKLRADANSDLSIELDWSDAKNATGYYVWMYDEKTKEFKKIGTTKSSKYRVTRLKEGVKYRFTVQSYRSVKKVSAIGPMSGEVSATAKTLSKLAKQVHGRYFNATLRRTTKGTVVGTKTTKTLKKGTKVTSTGRSSNTITVILKDGTRVRVPGKNLRYNSMHTTTKEFSRAAKEAFVNEKGYSSPTNYLVWISQYTTNVNVFRGSKGHWKLVRSMPCIVGKDGKTPTGVHRIRFQEPYAFGGYRIYFTWNPVKMWGNSFHGRTNSSTRGALSSGCIRLSQADLNYIRDNCRTGTTVVSY